MQKAYLNALYELMQKDNNVCSLLSDSGTEYDEMIFREFPNQCFNFGIAEQNKVAAAAGMAAFGKIPFVYTTGAFLAYRSYEFIRDDVCLQNRNVKIVGMGSGLSWCTLGPSHHTTEDLSALRAIPNLTILSPASPLEVKECINAAYNMVGPVYIRTGMSNEDEIYGDQYNFIIGKNILINDGKDIVVFATGSVISQAKEAVLKLEEQGISVKIINVHTIKPLDAVGILNSIKNCKNIFTVEEHNVIGGLGGAISEVLARNAVGIPLIPIGLNDKFGVGYGTHKEVLTMNGLDAQEIYNSICANIK